MELIILIMLLANVYKKNAFMLKNLEVLDTCTELRIEPQKKWAQLILSPDTKRASTRYLSSRRRIACQRSEVELNHTRRESAD